MSSKMNRLRALDAEMVQHIIERGKMWERRQKLVRELRDSEELAAYQEELREWLGEATNQIEGGLK